MSWLLWERKGVSLDSAWKGKEMGRCLQITVGMSYAHLTRDEVRHMAAAMLAWSEHLVQEETEKKWLEEGEE